MAPASGSVFLSPGQQRSQGKKDNGSVPIAVYEFLSLVASPQPGRWWSPLSLEAIQFQDMAQLREDEPCWRKTIRRSHRLCGFLHAIIVPRFITIPGRRRRLNHVTLQQPPKERPQKVDTFVRAKRADPPRKCFFRFLLNKPVMKQGRTVVKGVLWGGHFVIL